MPALAESDGQAPEDGLASLFGDDLASSSAASASGGEADSASWGARVSRRSRARLLLLIFPLGAIAFAVYAGIHLFTFDHTFTERTCTVSSVSAEQHNDRGRPIWTVDTSCGALLINSGNTVDLQQAESLIAVLQPGKTYLMKLAGTGSSLELVSARPAQ